MKVLGYASEDLGYASCVNTILSTVKALGYASEDFTNYFKH